MEYDNAKAFSLPLFPMPFFEKAATNTRELPPHTVDVWRLSLDKNYAVSHVLSTEEQQRADRFYFPLHRQRFQQAHGQLRMLLGYYSRQAPAQIPLAQAKHGKPYLLETNIRFNLSHSGNIALVAIGTDFDLGVDIEEFSARPYLGIAKHMFSQPEIAQLQGSPAHLRTHVFFSIWSQKEAFIKACGLGLRYPTQQFSVQHSLAQPYLITDRLHQQDWQMLAFYCQPGVASALCYHPSCSQVRFWQFEPGPLFSAAG
ncbi:MAG: 4'-phosphopantetheinyl transferase superfamily protein [Legionellaceae bacterium]|nr:4'-phosphopantetheinyl transferase superfamily protein [Legionellaceae bacterium]